MRDYGQVQCAWWGHPETSALSDNAKLLFLYLLTGPHSNGLGCYRLPDGYVSADLGKGFETVSKGLNELEEKGLAYRCRDTQFVYIPKYLKWNPVSNKNVAAARTKEFKDIPSNFLYIQSLAADILQYGKHFDEPFRNRLETLVGRPSETVSKQEPNLTEPNRTINHPLPGQDVSWGAVQ